MALAYGLVACGRASPPPDGPAVAGEISAESRTTVTAPHETDAALRPQPKPTSTSPVWREALVFETGEVREPPGDIVLWWQLDEASDADVESVTVDPDFGGVGRGATRNDGWRVVPAEGPVRLVRGGPAVQVLAGAVPAGEYQHVFIAARSATVAGSFGEQSLVAHVEPIARSVTVLAAGKVEVDIILIVIKSPGGLLQLFVKDAQIRAVVGTDLATATQGA